MRRGETDSPPGPRPLSWMPASELSPAAAETASHGTRSSIHRPQRRPRDELKRRPSSPCNPCCPAQSPAPMASLPSSRTPPVAADLPQRQSERLLLFAPSFSQAKTLWPSVWPGLTVRWPRLPRTAAIMLLFLVAALALPLPVTSLESENFPRANNENSNHPHGGVSNDKHLANRINDNLRDVKTNDKMIKKSNIQGVRNSGNSIGHGGADGDGVRAQAVKADKPAEDRLKQLALQQKQRAADAAAIESRRNDEIKQQIADHEKRYAAKQQQLEEKEKLRKEREKILAEKRLIEKKKDEQEDKEQQRQGNVQKKIPGLNQQQEDLIDQHRREAKEGDNRDALNIPKKGSHDSVIQQAFVKPRESFDGAAVPANVREEAVLNQPRPVKFKQAVEPGAAADPEHGQDGMPKKAGYGKEDNTDTDRVRAEDQVAHAMRVGVKRADTGGEGSSNSENGNDASARQEPALPKENSILGIPVEQHPQHQNINNRNVYEGGSNNNNNDGYNNNFQGGANNYVNNHDSGNNAGSYNDQQFQRQPEQPAVGGMNLAWDWEDFSITFNNYGAAEMKVRRSPHPTTGEPWPMPQYYTKKDNKFYRISRDLKLVPTKVTCDILEEGLSRHLQRILRGSVEDMYDNLQNAEGTFIDDPAPKYQRDEYAKAHFITRVEIRVRNPCSKYPSLESDESYDLVVKRKKTYVWANEVWGALRGLETLGQLVWRGTDGQLYIKETVVSDYPRFPHRGLHIDTSRHFLFKEILLDIIDSMEMNKLNVFHWHIVDDQSFPYESKVYPELSRKGAYHPTYVYSLEDIADIIEYARLRGVRVMPEFDTPGHTYSWGLSRPELLTQCYSMDRIVKGYLGPIDPSKNATYRFLDTLFQEVIDVFQDTYLHLGGDEVPLGCWQSNPEVMAFANELAKLPKVTNAQTAQAYNNNFGFSMWSEDIKRVYEYYENRLIKILTEIAKKKKRKIKYVMWQEVMNNNLQLPNDTIIQVWMGDMADVSRAISMGYQVLYSTCWYLDHIEYGTKWPKYYQCDPADNSYERPEPGEEDYDNKQDDYDYAPEHQVNDDEERGAADYGYHIDESKVLGGEIAFWSEYFSNENLIPLMWPRASAGAERLWSNKEVKNLDKAAERLSEHRCRMIRRGINAGEISGPGYCLHAPPKRRVFNDTAGCKGGNCTGRSHNIVQIEDIELHLRQRGTSITDCGSVFSRGNSGPLILLLIVLIVVVGGAGACTLTRSPTRLHRSRLCRSRSVLFVFVGVLLVYFLCYTTIWMRAFEFSGSFHKTFQEDSGGDQSNNAEVDA